MYEKRNVSNSLQNAAYYKGYKYNSIQRLHDTGKMHGVKRVVVFCIMTAILPTILIITPLYLRHNVYANTAYLVAESDILKITEGMSSIFCQRHTLQMNSTFNAFQINTMPEISRKRKHIRLKKSMRLPDDTLEYWGFFLLEGATVKLKVCSRYEGSRILVVKGEKNLKTCGLLDHNLKKIGAHMDQDYKQVKVIFETNAELVNSASHDKRFTASKHESNYDENTGAEDLRDLKTEDETRSGDDRTVRKTENIIKKNIDSKVQSSDNLTVDVSGLLNSTFKVEEQQNFNYSKTSSVSPSRANDDVAQDSSGSISSGGGSNETSAAAHRKRHPRRKKFSELQTKLYKLHSELSSGEVIDLKKVKRTRVRRSEVKQIYDGGIEHGGNAVNFSNVKSDENSASSFESGLLTCYAGQILLTQSFPPSHLCSNVTYLESGKNSSAAASSDVHLLETVHQVVTDGYYYYIFYSDNDIIVNEIHAIFDIYKPTFLYTNISSSKSCINQTECTFDVSMLSDESVFIEVLTRDGIEHEGDDITLLVSVCEPRTSVYILFPFAVMLLILGCAFL